MLRWLLILCLLPAVSVAQTDNRCRGRLAADGFVGGTRALLTGLLGLDSVDWAQTDDGWVAAGLNDEDFEKAKETLLELKEWFAAGSRGSIRGYRGRYTAEDAAVGVAFWGFLGAVGGAASFMVPPETSGLLKGLVYGITALAALKALRWAKTMENAQARDYGMPPSQLWDALGPMQGPLQYWLERLAIDGHVNVVVHLTRASLQRYLEGRAGETAVRIALDGRI